LKKLKKKIFDIVIVGGGPAGISASIQLKRYGLNPVLIEKHRLGGSLLNANLIENYLGFPEGISGEDLIELIKKQFQPYNVTTIFSEVEKIIRNKDYFEIILTNNKIYAKSVIVAIGLMPKKLNLQNEDELYNSKRLFYEIKEIPKNVKDKNFSVGGSGDVVFDYAINLSKRGNKVDILCRNKPKCLDILIRRAENNRNIMVFTNTKIRKLEYKKNKVYSICNNGLIEGDYIIVAVGKKQNICILDKNTIKGSLSKIESLGVFIAGDVKRGLFRQLGISVGDGLLGAMKVKRYLDKNGNNK
jgi:thioredoxin reductase (NADPH)